MHACGHDTHITAAIGAATLLAHALDSWSGTAVFLFQPGEETAVGAAAMVADGLWHRAREPAVIYGQHVWSGRAGEIEISSGPAMAMADSWKVTVHGRGGHGSRPEATTDPVLLAAHMVVRIQSIVAREVHPQNSAVVTVATFHAGLKENIIPARAEFTVNVRTLDVDVRERVLAALRRVITAEADASGAPEPEIDELYTFPLLLNDPVETERVRAALGAALGRRWFSRGLPAWAARTSVPWPVPSACRPSTGSSAACPTRSSTERLPCRRTTRRFSPPLSSRR